MVWKNALVIGASGGIGSAITTRLQTQGTRVTGLSRRADGLDLTDSSSIVRHFDGLVEKFDLVVVATGALEINGAAPEKALGQITAAAMLDQFALNAVGPALVLARLAPLLARDCPSHVAVLSARVGSIGDNRLGGWHSYRAAKAALNQFVKGASIELARTHKQLACVAIHPGTVETEFTKKYVGRHPAVPAAQAAENILDVLQGLSVTESGGFYDWQGKTVPW